MINKTRTPIKLLSVQSKNNNCDRVSELELQLKEARSHILFLKDKNKELMHKADAYERKFQDMRLMEEELEFRREQEKQMQEHLDNYQEINKKLRQQLNQMEASLKKQASIPETHSSTIYTEASKNHQRRLSTTLLIEENCVLPDNSSHHRRSSAESSKENHPLTPKSRVNINFDAFCKNEISSMQQINARRKVFL